MRRYHNHRVRRPLTTLANAAMASSLLLLLVTGCNARHAAPPAATTPGKGRWPRFPRFGRTAGWWRSIWMRPSMAPAHPRSCIGGAVGVAPTIRVAPGDEIRVTLHNRLPKGTQAPNEVNLHFHSLEVSPRAPSDDAMRLAPPGGAIAYDVRIPRSQPPGLYWYHPHAHGQTYWQITSGMAGALVVEGLQQRMPALASLRKRFTNVERQPVRIA